MEPTASDPELRNSVRCHRVTRFGGDAFFGRFFGRLVVLA